MPKLEFMVIRHLFRGTGHWCVKGDHIICQERLCPSYDKNKYAVATTHDDPFCLDCLRAAEEEYNVVSPERFAHGAEQFDKADNRAGGSTSGSNVNSDRRAFLNRSMTRKSNQPAEST